MRVDVRSSLLPTPERICNVSDVNIESGCVGRPVHSVHVMPVEGKNISCHTRFLKGSPDELSSLSRSDGRDHIGRCGRVEPLLQRMAMPPVRRDHRCRHCGQSERSPGTEALRAATTRSRQSHGLVGEMPYGWRPMKGYRTEHATGPQLVG